MLVLASLALNNSPTNSNPDYSGLGQETAEKQAPSALDFVGIFSQAVDACKAQNGRKVAQLQALNSCIAEYNRTVSVKKWRVDTNKRKIIANLLRVPIASVHTLAQHYDQHRHSSSGTPSPLSVQCVWFEICGRIDVKHVGGMTCRQLAVKHVGGMTCRQLAVKHVGGMTCRQLAVSMCVCVFLMRLSSVQSSRICNTCFSLKVSSSLVPSFEPLTSSCLVHDLFMLELNLD